ncbi:hypothetical protein KBTX_02936 [wastewater metagenome]|uniref:Cbb3-type cytochrome oxidase component FixQ n=2 Tax=unclassified sequences TaxID=12908 RepID=A0A5B8RDC8_9ZZZZ|nr:MULTISPECIES: cbb3-type cytochrome c oxidase subunit 3 [Arhodomonas]MCS4503174.1 cbb3-type cytochrome c oxidase subunit 3 [Arhodomonas aquaeolei]QEA06596.1 hypothetical protein KBTEX_02936 [uncultured organism]
MDSGTLSGIITAVLMAAFIGIIGWAYSKRRKKDFDHAARLPLDAERRDAEKGRNGQ